MTVVTVKVLSCFPPVYLAGAKPEYEKSVFDDRMESRREQRTTLPIRRVVGPADIAALAVHLMTNPAVTGAIFDIDGGRQLVEGGMTPMSTPLAKTM